MKTMIMLSILLASAAGVFMMQPNGGLKRAEQQLEATAGVKLKDTWPEFRDSLCKNMSGNELEDCRIYQTQHFEKQIKIFKQN